MAEPIKIKAVLKGDLADIRILATHPMETGIRKDASGKPLPPHYIQSLTVDLAGRRIVDAQVGPSIARNPVFFFKARGAKAGDKLTVSWIDNKGDKRTDEAIVGG